MEAEAEVVRLQLEEAKRKYEESKRIYDAHMAAIEEVRARRAAEAEAEAKGQQKIESHEQNSNVKKKNEVTE